MVTAVSPAGPGSKRGPRIFCPSNSNCTRPTEHEASVAPCHPDPDTGDGSPLRISDLFGEAAPGASGDLQRALPCPRFRPRVVSIPIDQDRRICVAMNRQSGDFFDSELEPARALRRPAFLCASRIAHAFASDVPGIGATACLTPEHDVVTLVATGLSNAQIGLRLRDQHADGQQALGAHLRQPELSNRTEAAAYSPDQRRQSGPPLPAG